jgi:predicted transcriptional regulator
MEDGIKGDPDWISVLKNGRKYRDQFLILRDILKVIEREDANQQTIMRLANVTSPDWIGYRGQLLKADLIRSTPTGANRYLYAIRPKGKKFLEQLDQLGQLIIAR